VDLFDVLLLPAAGLTRWFGRAAVALWWWGPHPDAAYERGSYGDRSRAGQTYRLVWRTGQVVGWLVVGPAVALIGWRIYSG
jgi:hypothetical protein